MASHYWPTNTCRLDTAKDRTPVWDYALHLGGLSATIFGFDMTSGEPQLGFFFFQYEADCVV